MPEQSSDTARLTSPHQASTPKPHRGTNSIPQHSDMLPIICVLGNWSSGTTAVTGYLRAMGAYSCPPHVHTNDPLTPDSFESREFRDKCASIYGELSLDRIGEPESFSNWLLPWLQRQSQLALASGCTHIILKHPLAAFLVKEIQDVCSPRWVIVTRKFHDIEATRARRRWHMTYGATGARKIYSTLFTAMIANGLSGYLVSFNDFLNDQHIRTDVANFCGLDPSNEEIENAEGWLR